MGLRNPMKSLRPVIRNTRFIISEVKIFTINNLFGLRMLEFYRTSTSDHENEQ